MPFSFSITCTASMISRLISSPSSFVVDQVAPDDPVVGELHGLTGGGHAHGAGAGLDELTAETAAAGNVAGGAERDPPAHHAGEVGRLAQRPLRSGRRD